MYKIKNILFLLLSLETALQILYLHIYGLIQRYLHGAPRQDSNPEPPYIAARRTNHLAAAHPL
jgi:hypothetical protein